jgi:hypothetical protein
MDWNVQFLVAGAAIALLSGLLTGATQHVLTLRAESVRRGRGRASRQLVGSAGRELSEPNVKMGIAHELGDLRIESQLSNGDHPIGWLIVVEGVAAVGQKVPLYEENWIKVNRSSKAVVDMLGQMPTEYQAAIIYDSDRFVIYDACPFYQVKVNGAFVNGRYSQKTHLNEGDVLQFDTEISLRYDANATMRFHLN